MASDTNNIRYDTEINLKNKKLDMNKLRDSGLEYVSSNGKFFPAKFQADIFCHCPQRCQKYQTREQWKELFDQFYGLADQAKQNAFLRTHIQIKRMLTNDTTKKGRHKRRITCRYQVPLLKPEETIEKYLYKLSEDSREVCQKAFMNILAVSEKRVRQQRENNIPNLTPLATTTKLPKSDNKMQNWLEHYNNADEHTTSGEKRKRAVNQDEPLDLSKMPEKVTTSIPVAIDKEKLYELAAMLGLPKQLVNEEMMEKYEAMVRMNLMKQQKEKYKTKKKSSSPPRPQAPVKRLSEQVLGLNENLTILPIQTVNNGDLTITPVMPASQPVLNYDIMQVNNFFQNQLWRPELIGLTVTADENSPTIVPT